MNKPSSTIQAAGIAGFTASTLLLLVKIFAPAVYVQIPPEYQGHLVTVFVIVAGYLKKAKPAPARDGHR